MNNNEIVERLTKTRNEKPSAFYDDVYGISCQTGIYHDDIIGLYNDSMDEEEEYTCTDDLGCGEAPCICTYKYDV